MTSMVPQMVMLDKKQRAGLAVVERRSSADYALLKLGIAMAIA